MSHRRVVVSVSKQRSATPETPAHEPSRTEHRSAPSERGGVDARVGPATAVSAVIAVQVAAYAAVAAVGRPTLYVPVAVGSAALLGWRTGDGWFGVVTATLGSLLVLALGVPLLAFAFQLDPGLVAAAAGRPAVHRMLFVTVYAPLLAAGVATVVGVPLAYLLARGFTGAAVVQSLVDLPLVVPHSVAGIVVLFGFGRGGVFPSVPILSSLPGVVLALVFVSAPYVVAATRDAFAAVDDDLRRAARSQGASPFETFRRVTLPLAKRGVVTGGVLAWARGVSEFGAVAVVAYTVQLFVPGVGQVTAQHAPVFVYTTYTSRGLAEGGAVAAVLLVVSAGIFLLVRWATDGNGVGVVR